MLKFLISTMFFISGFAHAEIFVGLKSYNDSTQLRLMQNTSNQSYLGTQELYAGWKFESGWSLSAMTVQSSNYNNKDSSRPGMQWQNSDPSITIGHPAIYDNGKLRIGGQFRRYFAGSDYFVGRKISEYAYYSFLEYFLPDGEKVFNAFIPRYYFEPNYFADDTTLYFEDTTNWSRKITSSFSAGFGQWTQIENHAQTATGVCSEIYPFAEYHWSHNVVISPRLLFPVYTTGSVYQGPTSIATDNIRAEILFQASL